jgi:signal transduction histidine kinase
MESTDRTQPWFATMTPERRIVELTILYEVSRALQRTVDEDLALYTILVGLTHGRGLGFNRAFILLIDQEERFLQGRLAIGPSSPQEAWTIWHELREKHLGLGELLDSLSLAGIKRDQAVNEIVSRLSIPLDETAHPLMQILQSREACLAINGSFNPIGLPVPAELSAILGSENFAAAPLYLADKSLGIIIADNAINRAPIEITCLKLLQIYAQQASSALQNTRLYRKLMEEISQCENTNANLRESQYHLLRAERLSAMGKMAALLAHEIRTPLVLIGGFARRLSRSMSSEDSRAEEMEIIVSEVARLERLVGEVLGYAKLDKPEYRRKDINSLIGSVMATMHDELERSAITVVFDLDPHLPQIEIDESQLRQALLNLISNAVDAMTSGGRLRLETSSDGDFLEIGISDTGTGINKQYWDKLFDPFFTTKVTGTGLGLAIVSQVIANHRGNLRFESVPDQGTSFHIRLALHPQSNGASSTSSLMALEQEVPS